MRILLNENDDDGDGNIHTQTDNIIYQHRIFIFRLATTFQKLFFILDVRMILIQKKKLLKNSKFILVIQFFVLSLMKKNCQKINQTD